MKTKITYPTKNDYNILKRKDPLLKMRKITDKEVIIAKDQNKIVGFLKFQYLWDDQPFMSLLKVNEKYQRKGIGTKLVKFWEKEMKKKKFDSVITSTQEDEEGQHFYRKLGYTDIGELSEINDGPKELFLIKKICLNSKISNKK